MRQKNVCTKTLKNLFNSSISFTLYSFKILNIYRQMEHKMLHNAPLSDISSIVFLIINQEKLLIKMNLYLN